MSHWKVTPEYDVYFITTSISLWECIFTSEPYFEVILSSLSHCVEKKGLHLHGYVVMPDHCHGIVSADEGKHLSDIMRDFGTYTSRQISDLLMSEHKMNLLERFRKAAREDRRGNDYKVWQGGFHPIAIYTEGFFLQKLNYIHQNPVRTGFVCEPEHWKYSSARNYLLDDHSLIKVECLCV